MLRALQGARLILKLVRQFHIVFFAPQAAAADATALAAAEVSANNPATMLLSLGQFGASWSLLRALQGARRLLKLVHQFHIVFFCPTGGCR
jgi:hypothetical protein